MADAIIAESDLYNNLRMCRYCRNSLNANKIPARSILNALEVDELPESLQQLTLFESILLQKAKCFQTVVRLFSTLPRNS